MVSDPRLEVSELDRVFGPAPSGHRRVRAPYRMSPLGAHTDHQDGLTCGFTLDRAISMVFRVTQRPLLRLRSREFEGEATVMFDADPAWESGWVAYPQGVVRELMRHHRLERGLEGIITGELPPGGISSSAALQVAVLLALLDANGITMPRDQAVRLVRAAEQASTGVNVGLLDPAVILNGRESALVVVDCRTETAQVHRVARNTPPFEWVLVDSGVPRSLRATPYNQRVEECRAAARRLGSTSEPPVLRDVDPETYRRRRGELEPTPRRRAEHYFSEVKRVRLFVQALAQGDLAALGRLVSASGESLTRDFDCGIPETRELLELLRAADGVLGASYCGGGWGGMLQALTEPGACVGLEASVLDVYRQRRPEAGARARVHRVGMGAGAHVL